MPIETKVDMPKQETPTFECGDIVIAENGLAVLCDGKYRSGSVYFSGSVIAEGEWKNGLFGTNGDDWRKEQFKRLPAGSKITIEVK